MDSQKSHILIVDDSPSDIQFLLELLKDSHRISVAKSGEKAVKSVLEHPDISVVLMDVSMPELDGYETCRRLKADPATEHVEVIFVTAHDSTDEKLKGYDVGGNDYLIKPVEPMELSRKVALAVHIQEQRRVSRKDMQMAMDTAMTAIMDAGEQALIIEFMRYSFQCDSFWQLADLVARTFGKFDLSCTVQIRAGEERIDATNIMPLVPLESELLFRLQDSGRLIEKDRRLIVNMDAISVLIRNLPEDREKAGRIRDHAAIIMEGARSKYEALVAVHELRDIVLSANRAIAENTEIYAAQRRQNLVILDALGDRIVRNLFVTGLTEEQEDMLTEIIADANEELYENDKVGANADEEIRRIIDRIHASNVFSGEAGD